MLNTTNTNSSRHDHCCTNDGAEKQPSASNSQRPGTEQIQKVVEDNNEGWKTHWDLLLALAILIVLLVLEYGFNIKLPNIPLIIINLIAWFLAGRNVLNLAFRKSKRGDFFNEFVLMSVATIGAFILGEYEEGVAVMVFYQIGEWFQDAAVSNAKKEHQNIIGH